MSAFSRAILAVLALTLLAAAPAAAQSVKFEVLSPAPQPTYVYASGGIPLNGEFILCIDGDAYGGLYPGGFDGEDYLGDDCPARTSPTTVSLPPAGVGGVPEPPGGVPTPPSGPPCQFPNGCITMLREALGGGAIPGSPGSRPCVSATGSGATDATCIGTLDQYLLVKPGTPGEIGVCTGAPGYFWGTGPDPADGGAGDDCPGAPPSPGGGETPPAEDSDGDGVADSGDRCPTVPASTGDGCPAEESGDTESGDGSQTADGSQQTADGSQQTSDGTQQTTDGSQQTTSGSEPTAPSGTERSRSADPPELPRIDIARRWVVVSRKGVATLPLSCETVRTDCRGTLELTAVRRTAAGRRVRVVLARADVVVLSGDTVQRTLRFTAEGRRMVAANKSIPASARFSLATRSGRIGGRDRVLLVRR